MIPHRKAKILIIDDEAEQAEALAIRLRSDEIEVMYCSPLDVSGEMVEESDLVLLDLNFQEESVSGFSELEPPDGLAFATLLRRQPALLSKTASPVAFALLSGKIKELADPFPETDRVVLLAKQHNLEWIFPKTEIGVNVTKILSLAKAVRDIPQDWANGIQDYTELATPLGIVNAEDFDLCWEEIEKCRPPTYEITQWTHGLAIIRWMLHKVLTYPCFLWDSHRVAARMRVNHSSFLAALEDRNSQLSTLLGGTEYTGILSDFDNRRWWRHRIEGLAWSLTNGDSQNTALLRSVLSDKSNYTFIVSDVARPLVCIDANYKTMERTMDISEVVRVQPDDWPSFADVAWMPIDEVLRNGELCAIVVHEDRPKLAAKGVL